MVNDVLPQVLMDHGAVKHELRHELNNLRDSFPEVFPLENLLGDDCVQIPLHVVFNLRHVLVKDFDEELEQDDLRSLAILGLEFFVD